MIDTIVDVSNTTLFLGAIAAFLASIIQGYSGFGGGLVIVPVLAILFSPLEAISITAVAALLGNLLLTRSAAKHVNWREVAPLVVALVVTVPVALTFLVSADPSVIRRGMGVFVLLAAILLASGWIYRGPRGILTSGLTGMLTGSVVGGFGIPAGPFMVVYYMSSTDPVPVQRANIVISVSFGIAVMTIGLIVSGAYSEETIARTIILVPAFIIGTRLGKRLFDIAPAAWFKKVTYGLLFITGISVILI